MNLIRSNLMRLSHKINFFLRKHPFKGAYRLTRFISGVLVPSPHKLKKPVIVKTPFGFDFWVENIEKPGVENYVYQYGIYEVGTISVIRACLREGDCFLDIGSNVGLMTVVAASQTGPSGKVVAFEPEPRVRGIIQKNVELNQFKNVTINDFAIGSESGALKLHLQDEISLGSATLSRQENGNDGIEVKVKKLDDYLQETQIPNIRMMKVDVEGWEHEVLSGAQQLLSSPDAPIICVEYSQLSHEEDEIKDVYKFITSVNDYHIYKLKKTKDWFSNLIKINSDADLPDHDNLFCFLPGHLETLPNDLLSKE